MAYISSNKINVFPSGNRSEDYPYAKLPTEFNLTNIINRLTDVDSFVVNKEYSSNGIVNPLEFNIMGYYFKVDADAVTTLTSTTFPSGPIYGTIKLNDISVGGYTFRELQNTTSGTTLDVGTEFQGITFGTTASSTSGEYSLKLLEKVNSVWMIPQDSKIKFNTNSTSKSVVLDDGILE